jgi:eukaryotic-like serine/threonine-protein kinase
MSGPAFHPDLLTAGDFPVPFGRYRLLGLLGEGGMARVFRAELEGPEGFRKPAAIKIIRGAVAARGESLRTSLIHEARLGGLLSHPNIVSTLDFGEHDGHLFIAMDLVEGWTLAEALAEVGPFPAELALEVTAQICEGLDHAHHLHDRGTATNLVHRDLKPSNVILDVTGRVRVMDFGIAKATNLHGNTTADGMTKGTPTYMSPEQAMGKPVDGRSDLFAVGALLYELVTGQRLFVGDTLAAVMYSVIEVETRLADPATFALLEGVPGLDEAIAGCLRADPEARHADAADLEDALREIQERLGRRTRLRTWVRDVLRPAAGGPEPEPTAEVSRPPTTAPLLDLDDDPITPMPPPALVTPTRLLAAASPDATIDDGDDDEPLAPTRAMPASPGASRRMLWIGLAVALAGLATLAVLGKVALKLLDSPGDEPVGQQTGAEPTLGAGQSESVDGAVEGAVEHVVEDAGAPTIEAGSTSPGGATDRSLTPDATEPATEARGDAREPRATPVRTPATTTSPRVVAATVSFDHSPPATVTVGMPLRLRVRVEPSDAPCTPRVRHGPVAGETRGYDSTPMTSAGAGAWEASIPVPYAEAYRTGIRYRVRCETADGEVLGAWPGGSFREVPALAR